MKIVGKGLIISGLVALMAPVALSVPSGAATDPYYANQTPYGNVASSRTATPPAGYTVNFLETVGRHGARSLTSDGPEIRSMAIWNRANKAKKVTKAGKTFPAELAKFKKAERSLGYGNLSLVGKDEWDGIGRRTADAYTGFFSRTVAKKDSVIFRTTAVQRTKDSAAAMRASIRKAYPSLAFGASAVDSTMAIESGSTAKGRAAMKRALGTKSAKAHARHLLGTLYTPGFVKTIKDPVAAALDVYLLYCTAPGMAGETSARFTSFVPAADRPSMAQAKDAQNFYRFGPGVSGQRNTYSQADPVLKDFFSRIDARLKGGKTAAVFRLAHGETTMPFAARIKAPGSHVGLASSKTFSYSNNPWRGAQAGKLAGNVEWALYTASGKAPLVTMRHNEVPVKFHKGCKAADASGMFYTVPELKHCLA